MLAILLFTFAADPLPTPKFAPLPVPKFAADGVSVTESNGEWVVKLNGRTFSVSKAESKETAVRLAKSAAGEKTTPAAKSATVKGHEHKCSSCGTVWSHADNAANPSHNCPTCGRQQLNKYRAVPVEVNPATAPAKPKRISLNGRWYDQYADGRLVECVT